MMTLEQIEAIPATHATVDEDLAWCDAQLANYTEQLESMQTKVNYLENGVTEVKWTPDPLGERYAALSQKVWAISFYKNTLMALKQSAAELTAVFTDDPNQTPKTSSC